MNWSLLLNCLHAAKHTCAEERVRFSISYPPTATVLQAKHTLLGGVGLLLLDLIAGRHLKPCTLQPRGLRRLALGQDVALLQNCVPNGSYEREHMHLCRYTTPD